MNTETIKEPTVEDFLFFYPEFSDEKAYPHSVIEYRLDMSKELCGKTRWGKMWAHGCYLATAHYLTVRNAQASGRGAGGGVISSKSADGLSVSFDTSVGQEANAGEFNATAYGREFAKLRRIYGMGAVQL